MYKIQKYDIYLQKDLFIQWIENLALQGFFIHDLYENSIFLKFRKDNPKKVKYALYFDVMMSVIEDFVDHAEELGWSLVGSESNKKTAFLFMAEDENVNPLEMDIEETHQRIGQGLKKEKFNLFLWGIVLLLSLRNFEISTSGMAVVQLIIYLFLFISLLVSYIRRHTMIHQSFEFTRWIAIKAIKIYMVMWAMIGLLFGFQVYVYLNAKQVEKSIHRDFVVSSIITHHNLTLERSTQSFFSLNPTASYLFQYQNENDYSTMVYQTRHYEIIEPDQNFLTEYLYQSHPAILQSFETLELIRNSEGEILYRNPYSHAEFLSVKKVKHLIYTLHSINLNLEEHLLILNEMGNGNVQ